MEEGRMENYEWRTTGGNGDGTAMLGASLSLAILHS